ncbi:MAG: uncharacterized protein JWO64_2845 [Hyphomicrobiales bacterium]|jgi:uncharacterized membrane protein|nr:uncharacterized protein [Hyphomicrobiales bacterium]
MTMIRKTLTGAIAALALGASVAATATPAAADWRGHRHGGNGGAVAAGVIGALALGALAAGSARNYYEPSYATPAYVGGGYGGDCYLQNQPAYDRWGRFRGYRQVTVCD